MYVGPAQRQQDLQAILQLQQENLPKNISKTEALEQGFVTVEHNLNLLSEMNDACAHTIARQGDDLAGYALVMLPAFKQRIPVLLPLFDRFGQLTWQNRKVEETSWVLMGQVCVAKPFRGQGVFAAMYREQQIRLTDDYDLIVTEISGHNHRSLRAHEKVGFEVIDTYQVDNEPWVVVALETIEQK